MARPHQMARTQAALALLALALCFAADPCAPGTVVAGPADPTPAAGDTGGAPPFPVEETGVRILLVGLDAADWQIADPLIEKGRLPNLARLKRAGAWTHLRSLSPMLSPLLWTSIATGKGASEHGIIDYLVRDPLTGKKVPISSRFRKAKAFWNIYTEAGRGVDVVGWWASWPAEKVRGHVVSDRVAYSLFGYSGRAEDTIGLVHPPDFLPAVEALRVSESRITLEDLQRFAPFTAEDLDASRRKLQGDPAQAYADPLNHLVRVLASTRTYHAAALKLLAGSRSDLLAVYYQGIDEVCHRFGQYIPPRLEWVDARLFEKYRDVVTRFYEYQDELLGELLRAAGPDTTVMIVSDHGFLSGSNRPAAPPDIEAQAVKWHRLYGIFLLAGPAARPGRLEPARLLEVAPTLLYLSGLPVPDDMPGRPILAAVDSTFRTRHPMARIATYEEEGGAGAPAGSGAAGSSAAADEEILLKLKSLGYIGSGDTDAGAPIVGEGAGVTLTNLYNAAVLRFEEGKLKESEDRLRKILERSADHAPSHALLSRVLDGEGRSPEAMAEAREALSLSSEPSPFLVGHYAQVARRAGALPEAEAFLTQYARIRPARAEPHVGLGFVKAMRGDIPAAIASFLRALEIDPRSSAAVTGLFNVYDRAPDRRAILAGIEKGVAANPDSGAHHTLLGMIYAKEGANAKAEAELRRALDLDPDRGAAIAALADVMARTGRAEEARALLERTLARDGSRTDVRLALGRLHAAAGRMDEAVRETTEATRTDPGNASAQAQAGMMLAVQGKAAPAIDHLRRALEIDPGLYDLRLHLATLYHEAGRLPECEAELKRAIQERPRDREPRELLAGLYQEQGRDADARRENEALRRLGSNP